MNDFIINIDRVFNQKTASFALKLETKTREKVGFKFSWILGKYKTGLFSHGEPRIYLAIESSENQKGIVSSESFFTSYYSAFTHLAGSPSALMDYLGKGSARAREEIWLKVYIKGNKEWSLQLTFGQFLDLYSSLCSFFTKIRHRLVQEEQKRYGDRIQYVELWKERTRELSKARIPKILKGTNSRVLTREFIGHDLDYLSFLTDLLPTFPVPTN